LGTVVGRWPLVVGVSHKLHSSNAGFIYCRSYDASGFELPIWRASLRCKAKCIYASRRILHGLKAVQDDVFVRGKLDLHKYPGVR
jgi:hypothetical protein